MKGWFKLPGRDGARTVAEQVLGLAPALAEARGKAVLDLGCAEGAIAVEFAKAGAARVVGIECNQDIVAVARAYCGELVSIEHGTLNEMPLPSGPWDIVLALAIIHKMYVPDKLIADIAATGAALVVVRLPGGSAGKIRTKRNGVPCDVNARFAAHGYALEMVTPGPRNELVQYWRRK